MIIPHQEFDTMATPRRPDDGAERIEDGAADLAGGNEGADISGEADGSGDRYQPAKGTNGSAGVPNYDPELCTFLVQLSQAPGDLDLYKVFADKLADWSDSRETLVRDLATPAVSPVWPSTVSGFPAPIVAARGWAASFRGSRVHAAVYPRSALHDVITEATRDDGRAWPRHRPATVAEARLPAKGRTTESLMGAVDDCRLRLLLAIFGTAPNKLACFQVLRTSSDMEEVKDVLYGRQAVDTLRWLNSLYKCDRARFSLVLRALLEDPRLRHLGCMAMSAVEPEWPALIASRLTAGE
jgi:hypothetical protein